MFHMQADTDILTGAIAGAVRAEFARQRFDYVELADIIHVSRATAYRRMQGEIPFTAKEIELVAAKLRISVEAIFNSAQFGAIVGERAA